MPWFLGDNRMFMEPRFAGGFALLAIWSLVWTAFALWHAARREEKGWFIVFLLVHTAGILEIIYLAFVVKIFSKPSRASRKRS